MTSINQKIREEVADQLGDLLNDHLLQKWRDHEYPDEREFIDVVYDAPNFGTHIGVREIHVRFLPKEVNK